ncbi:unnamed protein product [Ambrosiozyma monospora]|uniref:Unnamed protein product n=1 Tax=Ambrosiozyma monospora TaxID=43982 RepID=A0A9W7DCL7_AMBMO|nr:unnamed protein product [Ambrosiozyma monospora]
MSIRRINRQHAISITSTSSIPGPASVVKELVDNSIDAFQSFQRDDLSLSAQITIEVDASTGGLKYISVKDNGCGINKNDIPLMCLNSTTSKLTSWDTFKNGGIETCGFRGEALFFIASLAGSMEISTRTSSDVTCQRWNVNNQGVPMSLPQSVPGSKGTSVKVKELFKNNPPRKQYLKKHARKSIDEITSLVHSYALSYRFVRFQLKFVEVLPNGNVKNVNKPSPVVINNKTSALRLLSTILKLKNSSALFERTHTFEIEDDYKVQLDFVLPKMRAQDNCPKKGVKVLCVNKRPLNVSLNFGKSISKLLKNCYTSNLLLVPTSWFLEIKLPSDRVDPNIEPEKNDVLISCETQLLEGIQKFLMDEICQHCNLPINEGKIDQIDTEDGNDITLQEEIPQQNKSYIEKPAASVGYDNPIEQLILNDTIDEDDDLASLRELHERSIRGPAQCPSSPAPTPVPKHHPEPTILELSDNEDDISLTKLTGQSIQEQSTKFATDPVSEVENHGPPPTTAKKYIENIALAYQSNENDWSFSMTDEHGLSSDSNLAPSNENNIPVPSSSSQNLPSSELDKTLLADVTVSNPWVLSKMAYDMRKGKNKNQQTQHHLPTPETTIDSLDTSTVSIIHPSSTQAKANTSQILLPLQSRTQSYTQSQTQSQVQPPPTIRKRIPNAKHQRSIVDISTISIRDDGTGNSDYDYDDPIPTMQTQTQTQTRTQMKRKPNPKQQQLQSFKRSKRLANMSQDTLCLETQLNVGTSAAGLAHGISTTNTNTNDDSSGAGLDLGLGLVRGAVMDEQSWVKRKGNPSSYITAAFIEFVNRLDGYDGVDKDRLVIGNGSNGVFKLDISI